MASIKPGEVREAIVKIEKRGAADQAGRVLQRVKAVYRWAVIHERIASNPMLDLVLSEILKPREVQHRAAMADKELPEFLRKLDAYEGDPHTVHALRMLILTATRPGEVRGARWAEFDLDAALWVIPPERMKMRAEHRVVALVRYIVEEPVRAGGHEPVGERALPEQLLMALGIAVAPPEKPRYMPVYEHMTLGDKL